MMHARRPDLWILLLTMILPGGSCWTSPGPELRGDEARDMFRTLMLGWQDRANRLRTFEGYITRQAFRLPEEPSSAADSTLTTTAEGSLWFCAYADTPKGPEWVHESRASKPDGTFTAPDVTAFHDGVYGVRLSESTKWVLRHRPDRRGPKEGGEFDQFLMLHYVPDAYIRQHIETVGVTRERLGGQDCFRCDLAFKDTKDFRGVTYAWIDPGRGFAIRKVLSHITYAEQGERLGVDRAHEFFECTPGLWIPARTEEVAARATQGSPRWRWHSQSICHIISARVNQPLSPAVRRLLDAFTEEEEGKELQYEDRTADEVIVTPRRGLAKGNKEATDEKPLPVRDVLRKLWADVLEGPLKVSLSDNSLPAPSGQRVPVESLKFGYTKPPTKEMERR